jgi:cytochrome c556
MPVRPTALALAVAVALSATGLTAPVAVANEDLRPAVDARQAQFRLFSFNMTPLGMMAQGRLDYSAEAAQIAADNLVALTSLHQGRHFPAGSDNAAMERTRALPAIWDNQDELAARFEALRSAAAAMQETAGVDLASLQAGVRGVAGACQACHTQFRAN